MFVLISRSFQTIVFFSQASCLLIYSHKCKQKNDKVFLYLLYLHFYDFLTIKNPLCNMKQQKTWLATFFGPLAAILNFAYQCKQTAVSQKLSMVKNFLLRYFLHLIRCLNFWESFIFWGAKSGPLTHASAVK